MYLYTTIMYIYIYIYIYMCVCVYLACVESGVQSSAPSGRPVRDLMDMARTTTVNSVY